MDQTDNYEAMTRDRSFRLFMYLKELAQLKSAVVRDLGAYEQVIWFSDVPQCKGCFSVLVPERLAKEESLWIEVRRPNEPDQPRVPPQCANWIDPESEGGESFEEPELRDQIGDKVSPDRLENHPEVIDEWDDYVQNKWRPWAKRHKEWRQANGLYFQFFTIHEQMKKLGERYELLLGLGLLTWETPRGQVIKRHLVIGDANLTFDPDQAVFRVEGAASGVKLRFETEMVDHEYLPSPDMQLELEKLLSENQESPWDREAINSTLRRWIQSARSDGVYSEAEIPSPKCTVTPIVTFAPAIILRQRSQRSQVQCLNAIADQIKDGGVVPMGIRQVCGISECGHDDAGIESAKPINTDDTFLYLPLPVNDEQIEIVRQSGSRRGVLVQGPPGTGKSHTIANLICHFLAQGKRVLVTSQTPRALRVLKDKIPKEISSLCVTLLGDDRAARRELEQSVQSINQAYSRWNPTKHRKTESEFEAQLYDIQKRIADTERLLREAREINSYQHHVADGQYIGTAMHIASRIRAEDSRFNWLSDDVGESTPCPISNVEFKELLDLLRGLTPEYCSELSQHTIDPKCLPDVPEFVGLVNSESAAAKIHATFVHRTQSPHFHVLAQAGEHKRNNLRENILALNAAVGGIKNRFPWISQGVKDMLTDNDTPWRSLRSFVATQLAGLRPKVARAQQCAIEIPEAIQRITLRSDAENLLKHIEREVRLGWHPPIPMALGHEKVLAYTVEVSPHMSLGMIRSDAHELLEHLKKGRRKGWKFLSPPIVKRTRYLEHEVKINGRSCSNPEDLQLLLGHIALIQDIELFWTERVKINGHGCLDAQSLGDLITYLDTLEEIERLWSAFEGMDRKTEGSLLVQVAYLEERLEALDTIVALEKPLSAAKDSVKGIQGLAEPPWDGPRELESILLDLAAVDAEESLRQATSPFELAIERVRVAAADPDAHSVNQDILTALLQRDSNALAQCLHKLDALHEDQQRLQRRKILEVRLSRIVPHLVRQLWDTFTSEAWDGRAASFEDAWQWKRADIWLAKFNREHNTEENEISLESLHREYQKVISKLAATKAWEHCLAHMTEHQRSSLIAWADAMRKFGKGTGKRAHIYRRLAQQYMDECKEGIPAWIMPLYRVFETLDPKPEAFDVVIIDEASQTGPEGLAIEYLAKQCIIVGDAEQISPEAVGIDLSTVDALISKYLYDIPFKDLYGPEGSLFAHANRRFSGRIVLREHFRCMPEIIQFSNQLCYSATPLKPLRQYPPERLEPILVYHVPDGFREGSGGNVINRPEAEMLVDTVTKFCASPEYDAKTMGVISLQGEAQAKYIEGKLLERLTPTDIERRRIVCGDAYAFQGDERDVIFLSMVAAPNERIGPLMKESDKRRFNVAASRARDQLVLFHTATPNDLHPECMRYALLHYCLHPMCRELDLDLSKCESQFERGIAEAIANKGYQVIPQYLVAGYRIDLVVQGVKSELAVECDGDKWHGIEQYESDVARQRILERCGWRFWRVRGSEYYRNPEESLNSLWRTLSDMGIHPPGNRQSSPEGVQHTALISQRRVIPVTELSQPHSAEPSPHQGKPPLPSGPAHTSEAPPPPTRVDMIAERWRGFASSKSSEKPADVQREKERLESEIRETFDKLGEVTRYGVQYTRLEQFIEEIYGEHALIRLLPWELEDILAILRKMRRARDAKGIVDTSQHGPTQSPAPDVRDPKSIRSENTVASNRVEESEVYHYPAEFFFKMAREAKERDTFQKWERRLIFQTGKYRHRDWKLTLKQERHVLRLVEQARKEGFSVIKEFDATR